jgi:hypothetical protein
MTKTEINPNTRYVVPMLRITQCPDPLRWYAGMVGHLVPHRAGHQPIAGEYLSAEPSGFSNLVQAADCKEVKVSVSGRRLSEWPYAPVAAAAKPATNLFDGDVFVPGYAGPVIGLPPKTCATICNAMGICQALEDCQDKPRIDAQLAKPVSKGQSRTASMTEAVANIVVGFVVSVVITAWLLPAMGHQVSLSENLLMTSVFTVASLIRGFAIRRAFNRLHTKGGSHD